MFFSDEKTFCVDPVFNKQNNRVDRFEDLHRVSKTGGLVPHPARRRRTPCPTTWSLKDQGNPVCPQDHQEVGQGILRLQAGWGTRPHSQCCASLDEREHGFMAQELPASLNPRSKS
uniref:Uncharacterized protein n=1 Tax=Lepeophtheirus salmonis TaxID=72036 RepID=A0A0K2UU29_LEPSM